eukprot:750377-Hanusia_phi.AAC.3
MHLTSWQQRSSNPTKAFISSPETGQEAPPEYLQWKMSLKTQPCEGKHERRLYKQLGDLVTFAHQALKLLR